MRSTIAQAKVSASARLAIFLAATILCATEMIPTHPPRFSDYPFDQWAGSPDKSAIKWEVHLLPAELSVHQRLIERIQTVVPGSELAKRRGRGELVLLARYEDAEGHQWRSGARLNLVNVQEGVKSQEVRFNLSAFVKPGDYKVSLALLDTETMEHSFTRKTLRVAPLKSDPLPAAWLGLPAIEVLPAVDGPDAWFLPNVRDLLHLPLSGETPPAVPVVEASTEGGIHMFAATTNHVHASTAKAAKIDLLINTTPSEWSSSPASTQRRNMSVVIPALKVLSAINSAVHAPSAAVMDLTHHRIGLETSNAATLNWRALDKLLRENNPGIIDAKSLSTQSSMRDYFAHEIARRAQDSGPDRWLIVLSGPVVFARQDETALPVLPPDTHRHIVYLRFTGGFGGGPGGGRGGRGGGIPPGGVPGLGPDVQIGQPQRVIGPMPSLGTTLPGGFGRGPGGGMGGFPDDLERVIKPMGGQVISVTSPEVFRKTVAILIDQISATD